ncbi:MAG: hypothetical protein ABSC06_23920 [Rhodopila sp.]|jgi:hypothetical protein
MPWGLAAAAVGVAGNAIIGSSQSSSISQGQAQANAVLSPYSSTGTSADTQEASLLGLNGQAAATAAMGNFQSAPGYQYNVQQGLKAVDAGAASKGMLTSGQTIKAEQTLGSNLANQNFQSYVGNLNSLANYGITAAGGQASTDTSAAGAQAGIAGSTGTSALNSVTSGLGNTGVQNTLSGLFSSGSSSGGTNSTYTNPTTGTTYQSSSDPNANF